jgi:murein DD-endopeptidase MepM/ murein hydrolase activator NlpD
VNGVELDREEMSYEMIREPVEERVTVGVNAPIPTAIPVPSLPTGGGQQAPVAERKPGGFIWPVGGPGGRITCYLNGYPGHTGIDIGISGGYGTPVLASASGTVVLARYNAWGYGRHIMIDHGNGFVTLYAHNTELYVSVGDQVGQGQIIAGMGATGNAYGVHLHFEVRQNGRIMNPVNYVGG